MQLAVREMENKRFQSLINKQYETFEALCDTNLRYIHSSGAVDDLNSYMKKLHAGYYDYRQVNYDIENIIEMQDCIIVTANLHAELLINQQPSTLQNRAISVWKKYDQDLKLMIYQGTPFSFD